MTVTPEEREQMNLLCRRIQEENDPKTFGGLVRQLDELLSTQEERLTGRKQARS
ncbi:MAG: hypothetical protein LAP86_28030 [Acidobacteriia bacterium]|nr:hypothetical protein [Terriglobia bacterium]